MARLANKVAIVTGAGSGIGRAVALRFASEGAKVAVVDLFDDRAKEVARQATDAGGEAIALRVDVCDAQQVEDAVGETVRAFGGLDVVVNAAGIWSIRPIDELELEEWNRFLGVMVTGPMLMAKYAVGHLRQAGGGSIVNIGSGGSLVGSKGGPHYGAAKGGVHLFGKSLALQLAGDGIRVNTVCPGPTETGLYDDIGIDTVRGPMEAAVPLGRLGSPDEIANAVLFVASDEASFITGSAVVVDGGYTAQ